MSILVLTSDTLIGTPATGNLEYNGQFFGTDSNASRAQMQRITQATVQATTSGTGPFPFTGIPAWAKRITVQFNGVSANASFLLVQIGSGSYTSSGYVSAGINASSGGNTAVTSTAGFYSRWILWNEPSITQSLRDLKKRFPSLDITYKK